MTYFKPSCVYEFDDSGRTKGRQLWFPNIISNFSIQFKQKNINGKSKQKLFEKGFSDFTGKVGLKFKKLFI